MPRPFPVFLAIYFFVVPGCNVFDGLYEEGSSKDPRVLETDAEIALQRGEPDRAVAYLERALSRDRENPRIRAKLSTALLQANGIRLIAMIDLLGAITDAGDDVDTDGQSAAARTEVLVGDSEQFCNFEGEPREEIFLSNHSRYAEIRNTYDVLLRVDELLSSILDNPDWLGRLDVNVRSKSLLERAIVNVILVLMDVETRRIDLGVKLRHLSDGDVGVCANSDLDLADMERFIVCDQVPRMRTAIDSLRDRLANHQSGEGNSAASEAIEEIRKGIDRLEAEMDVSCV